MQARHRAVTPFALCSALLSLAAAPASRDQGARDLRPAPVYLAEKLPPVRSTFSSTPLGCAGMQFSDDGSRGLAWGQHVVAVWDLKKKAALRRWEYKDGYAWALLVGDGKTVVTLERYEGLSGWDVATGKRLHNYDRSGVHDYEGQVIGGKGRVLAVGYLGRSIERWDVRTGKGLTRLKLPAVGEHQVIRALAYCSARGLLAAAVSADASEGAVLVWDEKSGALLQRLDWPGIHRCNGLAFSPDGRSLTCAAEHEATQAERDKASEEGIDHRDLDHVCRVRQWEVNSGGVAFTVSEGYPAARSVLFSPDGSLFVVEAGARQRGYQVYAGSDGRKLGRWTPETRAQQSVQLCNFLPGTLRLAAESDGLICYDLRVFLPRARKPSTPSSDALARAWDQLAFADAVKGRAATQTLIDGGARSVSLLAKNLRPAATAPDRRIDALIADLDSDDGGKRDAASAELERLGPRAARQVRAAYADPPSAEVRRRLRGLVRRLDRPAFGQADLSTLRAIEVLERAGTDHARRVLLRLCGGAEGAIETEEARAALARIAK
jgi:hypothetical protein